MFAAPRNPPASSQRDTNWCSVAEAAPRICLARPSICAEDFQKKIRGSKIFRAISLQGGYGGRRLFSKGLQKAPFEKKSTCAILCPGTVLRNQNFARAQVPDQIHFSGFEKILTENHKSTSEDPMICSMLARQTLRLVAFEFLGGVQIWARATLR